MGKTLASVAIAFWVYVQQKTGWNFPAPIWIGNLWWIFSCVFFVRCFFHLIGGSKLFFCRILVFFSAGGPFSQFWPPAVCLLNWFPWSPASYLWPVAPWHGCCPPLSGDQKVTQRPPGRGIPGSASGATIPASGKKVTKTGWEILKGTGHRKKHVFWVGSQGGFWGRFLRVFSKDFYVVMTS